MTDKASKPDQKNNKKSSSLIVWILGGLLLACVAYIWHSQNERKEVEEYLIMEKEQAIEDLTSLEESYDMMLITNDSLNTEVTEARDRIVTLRDSIQDMKASVALLGRYKRQVAQLKREKRELFLLADSLDRMNQILTVQRDKAEEDLKEQAAMNRKLSDQNLKLAKNVEEASILGIRNVRSNAIQVSSSGRVRTTKRARKTDKIRVCFTFEKNKLAEASDRDIYVRVATPDDKLLGSEKSGNYFEINGERLQYSGKTNIFYENEELDVCVFVDGYKDEFVRGTYLVGIYADGQFIGETEMELN